MSKLIVSAKYFLQACEKFQVSLVDNLNTGAYYRTEDGRILEFHLKTKEIAEAILKAGLTVEMPVGETYELPNSDHLFE